MKYVGKHIFVADLKDSPFELPDGAVIIYSENIKLGGKNGIMVYYGEPIKI
jgi:hypothetical protein